MTDALSRRLQQLHFASSGQEALLSVLVAANALNDAMDAICEKYGITRPQYNVLRILRGVHPKGHPRCEIARRMIERAPDITRLVDRLQERGLVKRSRGASDQRQAVTSITAKGLRLLETMQPEVALQIDGLGGRLTDAECRELSRLCAQIFEEQPIAPSNSDAASSPR
jgi:DNA-binding MarR family transcriptional regulator